MPFLELVDDTLRDVRSTTAEEMNRDRNQRDYEQNVDQPADDFLEEEEPEQPQNQQHAADDQQH
jgi:hypothetical protein